MNSGLTSGLASAPLRTAVLVRTARGAIQLSDASSMIKGNPRGSCAVDLQAGRNRAASTQVASGASSFAANDQNIASGILSTVFGYLNTASAEQSCVFGGQSNGASALLSVVVGGSANGVSAQRAIIVGGNQNIVTGERSGSIGGNLNVVNGVNSINLAGTNNACSGNTSAVLAGTVNTASGVSSITLGGFVNDATAIYCVASGSNSLANRRAMHAHASTGFSARGDAQWVRFVASNKTTDSTASTLFLDGTTAATRLTIPTNKVFSFVAQVTGINSDGTAVAKYIREGTIKNVGGLTSLVGSIITLGTDHEDNASTDISITADDTNDALQIQVTGIAAETWRWTAAVQGVEIAYGT